MTFGAAIGALSKWSGMHSSTPRRASVLEMSRNEHQGTHPLFRHDEFRKKTRNRVECTSYLRPGHHIGTALSKFHSGRHILREKSEDHKLWPNSHHASGWNPSYFTTAEEDGTPRSRCLQWGPSSLRLSVGLGGRYEFTLLSSLSSFSTLIQFNQLWFPNFCY